MRRRQFITLLGGAAAAWPLAARAQSDGRTRRIGVLMTGPATDAFTQADVAAFEQALRTLGWESRQNLRIEYRYSGFRRSTTDAAELVSLAPDVILATGSPAVVQLQQAPRTVPIVFVQVIDPVGAGFIASLAR